eukprot:6640984-Pyramimonas_sp.AAC.1
MGLSLAPFPSNRALRPGAHCRSCSAVSSGGGSWTPPGGASDAGTLSVDESASSAAAGCTPCVIGSVNSAAVV